MGRGLSFEVNVNAAESPVIDCHRDRSPLFIQRACTIWKFAVQWSPGCSANMLQRSPKGNIRPILSLPSLLKLITRMPVIMMFCDVDVCPLGIQLRLATHFTWASKQLAEGDDFWKIGLN